MKSLISLSLWLLWSQAIVAVGQDQKWLNVPDTPLEFSLLANKYTLALTNVSHRATVRHTLGCVDGKSHKIVRKLRTITVRLEPGQLSAGNLDSYISEFAACGASHSTLSVIRVTFGDGSAWSYKPERRAHP
jgi:hypothetical protein